MEDKFPYVVGQEAEIFDGDEWKHGRIIYDRGFRDGIVTIKTDDGEKIWCEANRRDIYRPAMTIEEKIAKIAENYGYAEQSLELIEEIGELLQALHKYWRYDLKKGKRVIDRNGESAPKDSGNYINLTEELADVTIMMRQIIYLLSSESEVNQFIVDKLNRQLDRMEEENAD